MIKLLLIEDDRPFNESVCFFLSEEGFEAEGAFCADDAFRMFEEKRYDMVICDVMLPNVDGFEVAALLRNYDQDLPIIFLTALDDIKSKEKGYAIGIDDYLTKPIEMNELLWHIKALLRRSGIYRSRKLSIGDFTMDIASHSARYKEQNISLTVREFDLLYYLLASPGEIFTRSKLMEKCWENDSESTLRSVDVYITKLREKTKDCKGFEIVTVRGLGYKAVVCGEESL